MKENGAKMTSIDCAKLAKDLLGRSIANMHFVLNEYDVPDDFDLTEAMLEENLEVCPDCGWWHESFELHEINDGEKHVCEQCLEEYPEYDEWVGQ